MSPEAPSAAAEPRRSSRKRFKLAAAGEVKPDEIDREMSRAESRQRRAKEKPGARKEAVKDKPGVRKEAAKEKPEVMENAEAEIDRETSRGKRQRRSAKEKPSTHKRAAKNKPKEMKKLEAVAAAQQPVVAKALGRMEVDDAGGAVDEDVCAEEMAMEEEEEAAALEAEEEKAKGGGEGSAEKVGARKRVARPSTERRVDSTEDHFVDEPIADDEARRRWPERYRRKVRRFSEHVGLLFRIKWCLSV